MFLLHLRQLEKLVLIDTTFMGAFLNGLIIGSVTRLIHVVLDLVDFPLFFGALQ